jgi:hypothetical protein
MAVALSLVENHSTHYTGGGLGARAGLEGFGQEKIFFPLPRLETQAAHSVSLYRLCYPRSQKLKWHYKTNQVPTVLSIGYVSN